MTNKDTFKEENKDSSIESDQNTGFWRNIIGHLLVGTGGFILVLCVLEVPSLWNQVFVHENFPAIEIRVMATFAMMGLAWIVAGLFCWNRRFWIAMIAFAIGFIILSLGLPDR